MNTVILKESREKSLLRRHPWVFDGAILFVKGRPGMGETVQVLSTDGKPLGLGAYSPYSQIRVRIWTFDVSESIDEAWFRQKLVQAFQMRTALLQAPDQTAYRLVASEADGLPGFIIDQYGDYVVIQCLTAGAELWRDTVVKLLAELLPCKGILERSDVEVRGKEGLKTRIAPLWGEGLPSQVEVQEGSFRLWVDVVNGHKTGYYLDQRENRAALAAFATGKTVLNCFSYTGGFSLAALQGGAAHVLNVDASAGALALSAQNHQLNGLDASRYDHLEADIFKLLRKYRAENRQFDMVVLDPPKFIESKASLEKAARGYKDINRLAFHLLKPNGLLFTFSCSGLLEADLFQKIVADAALDAQREAQIIRRLGQSADHPSLLSFPESFYLKGFIIRAF